MKRTLLFVVFLTVGLLLAACGGSGGGGGGEAAGPESMSLEFAGFDDFRYEPASATVPAGAEVTVTFQNEGTLPHNWMLAPDDVNVTAVTEADALLPEAESGEIAGGETTTFTFTAPEAGTYKYVCTVPGHAAGGMVGTLTVTNP